MAINPNTVNILNIDELNNASSIGNDDLIVIGQGIYARKTTVAQLYQKFGLESLEDAVFELKQTQSNTDLGSVLRITDQPLQESEQLIARSNINATDRRLDELSSDLTEEERTIIRQKISAASSADIPDFQDELDGKVNTDGSNTTGGTWNIERLTNNEVGTYVNYDEFTNATIGIPSTDALGSTTGVMLMGEGVPIAIAENTNPEWDGYIYRTGAPNPGYPDEAKTGNYLIESKHRFRVHKHDNLDALDSGVGNVILNPYNAIEHQYFDVNISEVIDVLELEIQSPQWDELTGHEISRNNYGQRISVNVKTNANVMFTNVQGVQFPNGGKPGVYKFVWDVMWTFDGYSPNEF